MRFLLERYELGRLTAKLPLEEDVLLPTLILLRREHGAETVLHDGSRIFRTDEARLGLIHVRQQTELELTELAHADVCMGCSTDLHLGRCPNRDCTWGNPDDGA